METTSQSFFGDYQNKFDNYDKLPSNMYENIFKLGFDNNHPYYNILKTITIPNNLNDDLFFIIKPLPNDTWTNLSYLYYDTINLWWLIALLNNVFNPFKMPTTLKILKTEYLDMVLNAIHSQLI